MEVGDLVRVYNFTRSAREKFRMQGIYQKESRAYFVGLIVNIGNRTHLREVLPTHEGGASFTMLIAWRF